MTQAPSKSVSWPTVDLSGYGRAAEVRDRMKSKAASMFTAQKRMELHTIEWDLSGEVACSELWTEEEIATYLDLAAEEQGRAVGGDEGQSPKLATPDQEAADQSDSGSSSQTEDTTPPIRKALFMFTEPMSGWGEIAISYNAMSSILEHFAAFTGTFRYLEAFGIKQFYRDEALSGLDFHLRVDGATGALQVLADRAHLEWTETCYLLKYFQETELSTPSQPLWSIRHAFVYQKFCPEVARSDHLLIRLSNTMKDRLAHVLGNPPDASASFMADWTDLHSMLITSLEDGQRDMINYLDSEISTMFDRANMSSEDPTSPTPFDTLNQVSKDQKRIRFLVGTCQRVSRVLKANIETLDSLSRLARSVSEASTEGFLATIDRVRDQHLGYEQTANLLALQCHDVIEQYRDTINLRNSEVARLGIKASQDQTAATLELSVRSARETQILKTLTVVALIYVPASFSADFLQMGYLEVRPEGHGFRVDALPGMQLFAAIALPLVAATLGFYLYIEYRRHRAVERDEQDAQELGHCVVPAKRTTSS